MKNLLRMSLLGATCLLLASTSQLQAQRGGNDLGQMGGDQNDNQMGGRQMRQGGPGGFGGGQMGSMTQGTVTASTANKITIQTAKGDSYVISVSSDTRIMKDRQPIKFADIKPGDLLTAMGEVDASKKTIQAMMLNDVDAATVARAKENLGKTYILGKVAAIDSDNLKLTITRSDSVTQSVAVDEKTSFQRGTSGVVADVVAAGALGGGMGGGMGRMGGGRQGGAQPPSPESITLADIKVGDSIMATGTLKGDIFTVLKLGVAQPPPAGAGRRRNAGDQPPPQSPAPQ